MPESQLMRVAYNAHENAEQAALAAMQASLESESVEALACLCDPSWRWETRSSLGRWIIDLANEVLDTKLETALAAV